MKAGWRAFALMLLIIFGVELVVMLVLRALPPMPPSTADIVVALALTIFGAPLLWFIVAKPFARGAQAETYRAEARVASILQSSADGILTTDARGIISHFNAGAEKMFGYAASEAVGRNISQLFPEGAGTATGEYIAHVVADPDALRASGDVVKLDGRREGGEIFPAEVTITRLGRGGDTMLTAIVRDTTERTQAEQALQASEQRYRSLFANMLNGFAHCRMLYDDRDRPVDFVYLAVNDAFGRLTGLKNVVGQRVSDVIPGIREMSPEIFEAYGRVASTGVPETFEFDFKSQNQWLSIAVYSPARGSVVAVFDDITERRRAEEGLRLFRTLLDRSNDTIEVYDPETGRFLDVNEKGCLDHGYSREEYLTLNVADIDPTVDPSSFSRASEESRESGERLWEGLHRRKNGTTFPVEVSVSRIQLDREYAVAVVRDITERKRVEQVLQNSVERFQLASRATFNAIWDLDVRTNACWRNENFQTLFGYEAEEIEPDLEFWSDRLHPEDLERAKGSFNAALDSEREFWSEEYRFRRKDGSYAAVEERGYIIRDSHGRAVRMVGAMQDVTVRKHAERKLADAVRYVETMMEASPVGIIAYKTSGEVEFANAAAGHLVGGTVEQVKKLNFRQLESWRRSGLEAAAGAALASREPQAMEVHTTSSFGKEMWLYCQLISFTYEDELRILLLASDINDRKRAEEERRESEARYRSILNASPDAITIADLEGRMLLASPAALKMFGCAREEDLVGHLLFEFMVPGERDRAASSLANTLRGLAPELGEYRGLHSDGSTFDIEVNSDLVRGADGQPTAIVIVGREITEHKQAEMALRLQAAALLAAADAIVITDRAGVIEWINPAFTKLTGYTTDEALGKNPRNLVKSDKHTPAFYKDFWDTILAGRTWHGEMINRRKDDSLYTEDQSVTPVLDASGAITHFVAVKEDMTDRRQLEAEFRQAQKMESVGQLASGIAHDFNNLLTVINGMSQLVLAEGNNVDPVYADVQEILHAGERAATLTRQLLAFSRQQILEPRVLNFDTAVVRMESLLRRLLGEDIDLVVVPTPGLGNVKADPGQIEQVITNLAVNARDAMPRGGQLTIETQNVTIDKDYARQIGVTMPPGSYVLLAVSDSGVGMDEATRARIFEPFFTTKDPGKGTGLGLSTVYGIIKQSHGFIGVYSEVGQGTSFKIYLPQVTDAAGTDRPGPTVVSSSGTETILLVEDNAGLLKLATRFLEPAGYTVLGAGTGEEALLVLAHHAAPVHLLLTDVVMPGMSGRHLAELLAQTHPGMKVLYMSGYTSDTVVRHGVLEEKVSFINKPFNAAALLQKVREVLDSTDAGNSG